MCGIFGLIGHLDLETATLCRDRLAHRGPDAAGLWQGPGITLAHRRLAILDLSDRAAQPMTSACKRFHMVYNGEIYNFVELKAELEAHGHHFRTESDSEVLLAAFVQWGAACLERLNGMWAVAIWDERERTLFLARDRFGKKPLFTARTKNGFAFASEMKALMPLLDEIIPHPELTRSSKRIMSYEGTCECLIQGIERFPAGHWGQVRQGKLRLTRWWCTLDQLIDTPKSFDEQAELFQETFMDACRLRMRSDVPLGTALSGGLDSSGVICALSHIAAHSPTARGSNDFQHAFTASFPGTAQDETPQAKRVANHLNIPITCLDIDPRQTLDRFFEFTWLFEELHLTPVLPFMLTYGAMREHGITVSMDGHGADECFSGYLFDTRQALTDAGANPLQINNVLKAWYGGKPRSPRFPLPPRWQFIRDFHRERRAGLAVQSKDKNHPRWAGLDHLTRVLYVSTHETILPTLLRNYDRYSMASGVEIRMPFMDHRVVALAFSLPWTSKVRAGFTKAVVRKGLSSLVVPDIVWRKTKIGFNSPIVEWMQGPLKEFFADEISSQAFRESEVANQKLAQERFAGVLANPNATHDQGQAAWTALAPYFWEQAVLRGRR